MRRFIVSEALFPGARVRLSADESRHALRVLRLQAGDTVLISDGKGTEARGIIKEPDAEGAEIEVQELVSRSERAALVLLQAPLKGPKMDWLVEKATEMGVREIRLARSQFTVAAGEKTERWERVARAAVKQSGSPRIPVLHAVLPLEEAMAALPQEGLRVHLQPGAEKSLATVVRDGLATGTNCIVLAVGPEGGFSREEEAQLRAAGFIDAALSQQVLRGETAALAALAIVAHCIDF